MDALPNLRIGEREFQQSHYMDGRSDRLALVISEADYLALPQGAPVELRIGERWVWNLGTLKKPAALD